MGFREPAPDGRKERDGKPLFVLPAGTLLNNKYQVTYLTAGGMSVAYTTTCNDRKYFVKEVEAADSPRVMALIQERFMLERLNHPGIVRVRDFFEYDGFYYLVTDFIEGKTLDSLVTSHPFLEGKKVLDWSLQLYDIFEYLHRRNPPIVYRDLKPQNVMIDEAGDLHLIDFGIARVFKENQKNDTYPMGSAVTASPEHYGGRQTDERSDIYTIAATIHYLLTGGLCRSHALFEFPSARSVNEEVTEALEKVLEKALSIEPDERFSTIGEMRRAHLAAVGGVEEAASPAAGKDPTTKLARPLPPGVYRPATFLYAAATIVIMVITLLLFLSIRLSSRKNSPVIAKISSPVVSSPLAAALPVSPSMEPSSLPPSVAIAPVQPITGPGPAGAAPTVFVTVSVTPSSTPGASPTFRAPDLPGARYPMSGATPRRPAIELPPSETREHPVVSPMKTREPELLGLPSFDYSVPPSYMMVQNTTLSSGIEKIYLAFVPNRNGMENVRYLLVRILLVDSRKPLEYYYRDITKNAPVQPDEVPITIDGVSGVIYRYENVPPYAEKVFNQLMVCLRDPKGEALAILSAGCPQENLLSNEKQFMEYFKSFRFTGSDRTR